MNKKMILFLGLTCTLSVAATNALADNDNAPSCGYDADRAADLVKKGQERLQKAENILDQMEAKAVKGAEDLASLDAKNAAATAAGQPVKKFSSDLETAKDDDKLLPEALQKWGDCVVIIPGDQTLDLPFFPLVSGLNYGRGVEFCKGADGTFDKSKPTFVQMEGANFGFAIGYQQTDLVLAVSKDSSKNRNLLVTGDASVTAGVAGLGGGRDASIGGSLGMKSAIAASYSPTKNGLFAGISLDTANLNNDTAMNAAWNKKKLPKENFFMRLIHSSKKKKEDAACAQGGQPLANTNVASNDPEAAASSLIPAGSNAPAATNAVSNVPMDSTVKPAFGTDPTTAAPGVTTALAPSTTAAAAATGVTTDNAGTMVAPTGNTAVE